MLAPDCRGLTAPSSQSPWYIGLSDPSGSENSVLRIRTGSYRLCVLQVIILRPRPIRRHLNLPPRWPGSKSRPLPMTNIIGTSPFSNLLHYYYYYYTYYIISAFLEETTTAKYFEVLLLYCRYNNCACG